MLFTSYEFMASKGFVLLRLKIAHILAHPYRGGTQEYAIKLSAAQRKLGHEVSIFFVGKEINQEHSYIVTKRPLFNLFRNPVSIGFSFFMFKKALHYDVLHIHLPFPLTGDLVVILLKLFKRLKSAVFFATYHFDIDLDSHSRQIIANCYNHSILDFTLKFVDRIIVSSNAFFKRSHVLMKHCEKVDVIQMGIDTSLYSPSYKYPQRIIFVGRIIPEKGIDYLIRAMTYLDSKSTLVIVGKIVDPIYCAELRTLSETLGLKGRITFTGYLTQEELTIMYRNCKVVVLPSTTQLESFGITLLEAFASGKPIIASAVIPGAVELIQRSGCGVVVNPKDPLAIAKAIKTSHIYTEQIGRKARRYVEKNHDWKLVAKRIVSAYEVAFKAKNTSD